MKPFYSPSRPRAHRSRGFTLIEIMVALAILVLMLTIILVPINLGARITHIGTARADVQQASQQLLNRIAGELRQAVYVYPNDALPGVTDRAPFNRALDSTGLIPVNPSGFPYYRIQRDVLDAGYAAAITPGACNSSTPTTLNPNPNVRPVGNTARIDFLMPMRTNTGSVQTPVTAERYVISYYARRQFINQAYHPVDNPIVMFRAQMPYRLLSGTNSDGTDDYRVSTGIPNLLTAPERYPDQRIVGSSDCTSQAAAKNRGALWLYQSQFGEPNLELVSNETSNTSPASHQLVMPRDMGLAAPRASLLNTTVATRPLRSYQPSTTFIGDDTNDDGKIDRISISLVLAQFDSGGSEPRSQPVRLPMTVDLTNVR